MRKAPSTGGSARWIALATALVIAVSGVLVLGRLGQLDAVLQRMARARPGLLAVAAVLELGSFAGYVALATIVLGAGSRITWREGVQITFSGVVATRLLTAGGAGGIALTAWALRGAGLDASATARRVCTLLVLLYAVFFALLLGAAGWLAPGGAPRALVAVAIAVSLLVMGAALAIAFAGRRARSARGRLATAATIGADGLVAAAQLARRHRAVVPAAVAWWAFDIAVLWTTFEMFGAPPAVPVLVLCYFLGQIAQLIPVPGGVGPVEAGMIAAFVACGVRLDLAVVGVLGYQAISTWFPVAPGIWAYWRLRRTVAGWTEAARTA